MPQLGFPDPNLMPYLPMKTLDTSSKQPYRGYTGGPNVVGPMPNNFPQYPPELPMSSLPLLPPPPLEHFKMYDSLQPKSLDTSSKQESPDLASNTQSLSALLTHIYQRFGS